MKKYRLITIQQMNSEVFNNRPVYRIYSNKAELEMGVMSFSAASGQYLFNCRKITPGEFSASMLRDVLHFMDVIIPELQPAGLPADTIDAIHALMNAALPIDGWDRDFINSMAMHARFKHDRPLSKKQQVQLDKLLIRYEADPAVVRYREARRVPEIN